MVTQIVEHGSLITISVIHYSVQAVVSPPYLPEKLKELQKKAQSEAKEK
jgi:hypothetical protein